MKMSENAELLEMYLLDSNSALENLEQIILIAEETGYDCNMINEIFRIMHSIKGASASMEFNNIAELTHSMENVFHQMREDGSIGVDNKILTELLLKCKDFISKEIVKIASGGNADGEHLSIKKEVESFFHSLKVLKKENEGKAKEQKTVEAEKVGYNISEEVSLDLGGSKKFHARIFFTQNSGMENVRATILMQRLIECVNIVGQDPKDLGNEECTKTIVEKGFYFAFESHLDYDTIYNLIESNTLCLEKLELSIEKEISSRKEKIEAKIENKESKDSKLGTKENIPASNQPIKKGYLNVAVEKLDILMDITSEVIITEALLVQNPDLAGLELQNFMKVARQFKKITNELQDVVMSLRMLPISNTFNKMKRITRDAAEKLNKKVELIIVGENTEVDKNIVEYIGDPLMHIIRNSVDHGIENVELRKERNKNEVGHIILEAKHVGSEVWIIVKDDGGGLNKERIYEKAFEQGLTDKSIDELKDNDIYQFIFQPGFSTKDVATEMSGRGVGMDIVLKNIEKVHGSIIIDETSINGTNLILKIPLTLAIVDGMTVRVGKSKYSLPVESIKEILALKQENIIIDTDGKEIINIRGMFYPIIKLNERFKIKSDTQELTEGMTLVIQTMSGDICIFADELLGEQQMVVKPLPEYMKNVKGVSGCTLLGDGTISLILDNDKLME